jgi:hypothetical protein
MAPRFSSEVRKSLWIMFGLPLGAIAVIDLALLALCGWDVDKLFGSGLANVGEILGWLIALVVGLRWYSRS